jgi:hypothetical protein
MKESSRRTNMREVKLGDTTLTIDANNLSLRQDGTPALKMRPAEVDRVTKLIGIALSMESMQALPSKIDNSPFVIRFFEDHTLRLEAKDRDGSIRFTFGGGDGVIKALHQARDMSIDELRLGNNPRGVAGAMTEFIP